jgi:hypothetical protein
MALCCGLCLHSGALAGGLFGIGFSAEIDLGKISPAGGYLYIVPLKHQIWLLQRPGDTVSQPNRSHFALFESGHQLGPAHSLHQAISSEGHGRYSQWQNSLYFSSSDGSDPRTNGRAYTYAERLFVPLWASGPLAILGLLLGWLGAKSIVVSWGKATGRLVRRKLVFASVQSLKARIRIYVIVYSSCFFGFMAAVGYSHAPAFEPRLGGNQPLENRVEAYLRDPNGYNVIFLGDSRTYCGIHPELIEKFVPAAHGLNLSNFANWFPTQISEIEDLIGSIPKQTLVVWTVGSQNFSGISTGSLAIERVYPLHWSDLLRMSVAERGIPKGMFDNYIYYTPLLHGVLTLGEWRKALRGAGSQVLFSLRAAELDDSEHVSWKVSKLQGELPVDERRNALRRRSDNTSNSRVTNGQALETAKVSLAEKVSALQHAAMRDAGVDYAQVTTDHSQITSVIRYFHRGGYYRTEIDREYFRGKQREFGAAKISDSAARSFVVPEPGHMEWMLFRRALDLFKARGVRLVVNEIEEAPFVYGNPIVRQKWRDFMRHRVRPEVESRGFTYIREDFDKYSDRDYFDYNHLNSDGVTKYTQFLAASLANLVSVR